jgi:hypothetical protein
MDVQPENDVPETPEVKPIESTEKLSPQGIASMQGNDTVASSQPVPETKPETTSPPVDSNPPPEHWPQTTDGTEKGGASKIETGVEKPEKEIFTYRDNEIGSLKHRPSSPEGGG